jgi:pimeloyl-ACP methyl ester carboxylesterase
MESVIEFGPSRGLVGVLTQPPSGTSAHDVAVLIVNSGIIHRDGINRLHVRLARLLATRGYPCFRYDFPGIGDSEGGEVGEGIAQSNVAATIAAMHTLCASNIAERFVVVGLCSGAIHSFYAACSDPRIVGAVMIDPTAMFSTFRHRVNRVLKLVRRGLRPVAWWRLVTGRYRVVDGVRNISTRMTDPGAPTQLDPSRDRNAWIASRNAFQSLIERQVRLLLIITRHNVDVYSYQRQIYDAYPDVEKLEATLRVSRRPSADHTFSQEADRLFLDAEIVGWLDSWASGDSAQTARPGGSTPDAA